MFRRHKYVNKCLIMPFKVTFEPVDIEVAKSPLKHFFSEKCDHGGVRVRCGETKNETSANRSL